jgi:hypothetical protein
MSDTPIAVDVSQANMLANLNNTTYSVLIEQANKGLTLLSSITSNGNFTGLVGSYAAIFTGYKDYQATSLGRTFVGQYAAGDLGRYYGYTTNYYGNLRGLEWFSSGSPNITLTYDTMVAAATATGLISISANFVPTTVPLSAATFMVNQFEFINKYLWANPTNPSLSASLTDPTMKFGIQYNATTLKQVASAHEDNKGFYQNKVLYLTPLI